MYALNDAMQRREVRVRVLEKVKVLLFNYYFYISASDCSQFTFLLLRR